MTAPPTGETAPPAGETAMAIADCYHRFALAGVDMRIAAEHLEQLRIELDGGDPGALDRVDDVIALAGPAAGAELTALAAAAERRLLARARAVSAGGWIGLLAVLARAAAMLRGEHLARLWDTLAGGADAPGELAGELPEELRAKLGLDRAALATAIGRVRAARWAGSARLFRGLAAIAGDPRTAAQLLVHASAVALYFQARPGRARALLDEAETAAPVLSRIASQRGNLAVEAGDLAAAEQHHQRALRLAADERSADRADALTNLGDLEARRGRAREALVLYDDALRASPGSSGAMAAVIAMAGAPGMYAGLKARVADLVQRARGLDSAAAVRVTLMAGDACWRAGALDDARQWNAQLDGLDGGPAQGAAQRAQWALGTGGPAAAVSGFQRALALEPDLPEAWRQLAEAHLALGEIDEAAAAAARLAALEPEHFAAVTLPGAIAAARGEAAEAQRWLDAALADEPASPATVQLVEHAALRFTDDAERWLRDRLAALGKLGVAATCWNQEGNRQWSDRTAAIAAYRKAAWYEASPVIHRNLALALTDLHRFDEARDELIRADALVGSDDDRAASRDVLARIENEAGNLCIARGEPAGAIERYRASLDLDPDDPVVWANLATAYERAAESGDPVAALGHARDACQQALALRPGHAPDRARLTQLRARLALLTDFAQCGLGIPEPALALSVEIAEDVLPAIIDDAQQLRPAVTGVIDAFRAAITARHGLTLPGIRFRTADEVTGTMILGVRGAAAVIQPAGDDPIGALARGFAALERALAELIDHDMVARALADAKVVPPPDRAFLTAATLVARAFLEEGVALAPVAEWAAAVVDVWSRRPRSRIDLIDDVRAMPAIRRRLPANQPGRVRIELDPAIVASLVAHGDGKLAALAYDALAPALIEIARVADKAGQPAAIVVDPRIRYLLARTLAMIGTPVPVTSPAELVPLDEVAGAAAASRGVPS
jgi:tetratricopeptide (TPR) repeat protein